MNIEPNRAQPAETPCPCGDNYCSDLMPNNQDRSGCCQHCGYHDCDFCGWSDPVLQTAPATTEDLSGGAR